MDVALFEQFLLDAGFNAFAKEGAVRQDDGAATAVTQQVDDEHQEQVGGFFGAVSGREIFLSAVLFHAAEGWVGHYDIHAIAGGVTGVRFGEGVVVADVDRHFDAV